MNKIKTAFLILVSSICLPIGSFAQCPTAEFTLPGIVCDVDGIVSVLFGTDAGEGLGEFTAIPPGLVFADYGMIDPGSSMPDTYTITWTIPADGGCPELSTTQTLTILGTMEPCSIEDFHALIDTLYEACGPVNVCELCPGINCGGFPPSTGCILDVEGLSGTFSLTCTSGMAPCDNSYTTDILIIPASDPYFSYPGLSPCITGANPIPDSIASPGMGVFSISAAGEINPLTGEINMASLIPDSSYTITYTIDEGPCPSVASLEMTPNAPCLLPVYESGILCLEDGSLCPTEEPDPCWLDLAGDVISLSPGGCSLIFEPLSGCYLLSADCIPGTYTLTFEIPAMDGCAASASSFDLIIVDEDITDPYFTYTPTEVNCANEMLSPEFVATPGGVFTISEGGAIIDITTGSIDFSSAGAGLFDVTYSFTEPCNSSYTRTVNYIDAASSDFSWEIEEDGFTATFTSLAPSTPFYHVWNFGDGASSSSPSASTVVHEYASAGVYEACYTALWYGGCVYEVCHDIVIGEECAATAVVSGLSALSNPAGTGAALSWNPLVGATHYQVQGRPIGAASFAGLITPNNFKNIGGLTPGIEYEWRVRARCEDDVISDFSPLSTFTTVSPESLSKLQHSGYGFDLSPNPVREVLWLRVRGDYNDDVLVELISPEGRTILKDILYLSPNKEKRLLLGDVAAGMYFVKLTSGNSSIVKSIIVQQDLHKY